MKLLRKNVKIVSLYLIFVAFYSCDKNSAEPRDCLGVVGGSAVLDQCGICNGDGSTCSDNDSAGGDTGGDDGSSDGSDLECLEGHTYSLQTSICTPYEFLFNISIESAAYFFKEVTLGGELIGPNDWVGAFNGDICVGSRKWDTSACGNGVCDIVVMGADLNNPNYMSSGEIPTFKVFNSSDMSYDVVTASGEIELIGVGPENIEDGGWFNFGTWLIDLLSD